VFGGNFHFENWVNPVADVGLYDFSFPFPYGTSWQVSEALCNSYVPADYQVLVADAAARVYTKGFDVATFLAEGRKLRDQFTGLTQRVATLVNAIKAKDVRKANKQAQRLWLEARYAWRPLKADIESFSNAISELDKTRKRYSETVKRRLHYTSEVTETPLSNIYCNYKQIQQRIVEVSVSGSVTADIEPPRFMASPLITGWELIPFSFVLDWFVGVGTYLESLHLLFWSDQYSASGGYQVKVTHEVSYEYVSPLNSYSGDAWGQSRSVGTLKRRIPTTIPNLPQLRLRLDGFKILDLVYLTRSKLGLN
jgi:hypothetical protein